MTLPTPNIELKRCPDCNWTGTTAQLVHSKYILDDDLPDHSGECPNCGNEQDIEDYDDAEISQDNRR